MFPVALVTPPGSEGLIREAHYSGFFQGRSMEAGLLQVECGG